MTVWAATGHRSDKLGGYTYIAQSRVYRFARQALSEIRASVWIVGMAPGWDMAVAAAARYLGIPYVACVPFVGQELRWPEKLQQEYRDLSRSAVFVQIVSRGEYAPIKMQWRNERMVDKCDSLLALWDGSEGGTYNCLKYAWDKRPVRNVWDQWINYTG